VAAPKGNQNALGNPGGGRLSLYKPEYAELARKLALLGATDEELAGVIGVGVTTIHAWKHEHVEFAESQKEGKMAADGNVANRLYQRAMGYEHPEVDIRVVAGEIIQTPIIKIYPPDPTAAIFWLKNRQKAKWRDKIDAEISGPNGGPITITTPEQLSKLSTEELKALEAITQKLALAVSENNTTKDSHDQSTQEGN
jgi:hypothetical protein